MQKEDRGALLALGMLLAAVVLVTFLNSVSQYGQSTAAELQDPSMWFDQYVDPKDTLAQWIMTLLSIAATGASILAVILVRRTLTESRKTTGAAIRAAEAAEASTKIAYEMGVYANQAYISLPEVRAVLVPIHSDGHDYHGLHVSMRVWNDGATPAIQPSKMIAIFRPGREGKHELIAAVQNATFPRDIRPDDTEFFIYDEILPIPAELDEALRRRYKLGIEGQIAYNVVTDNLARFTDFKFRIGPIEDVNSNVLKVENVHYNRQRPQMPQFSAFATQASPSQK